MNKDSVIEENYNNWTQSPFDTTTIKNVKSLSMCFQLKINYLFNID